MPGMIIPQFALAVRQPWAWAIIHGGKDIENRTVDAIAKGAMKPGRIAICASKGMTRDEYESAANFIGANHAVCPPPHELKRGGIIGAVTVLEIVSKSYSPWFVEQRRGRGLVLVEPEASAFVPCTGQLGYFRWKPNPEGRAEPPALGMLPGKAKRQQAAIEPEADLFTTSRL